MDWNINMDSIQQAKTWTRARNSILEKEKNYLVGGKGVPKGSMAPTIKFI